MRRSHVQRAPRFGEVTAPRVGLPAVELVWGPPGSGKSTYIRERMLPGDIVIDYDKLWQALTICSHERPDHLVKAVFGARDGALAAVASGQASPAKVWIEACAPTVARRWHAMRPFVHAVDHAVIVPREESARRIKAREASPARAAALIEVLAEWWRDYEGDPARR